MFELKAFDITIEAVEVQDRQIERQYLRRNSSIERRGGGPRRSKRRTSTNGKEMRPTVETGIGRQSARINTNKERGESFYLLFDYIFILNINYCS